ncbi:uncharacterized protein LOC106644746 [Copidosoma floridanum]|uniref:uncharacterized protein LOC106644746 n=1 Tax=Copidosoma floridanum TaxID=29053 RepID=UPI0006C99E3C|nr:uncharacterized protein LOC106644746 [Copidosoma floridanum]
MAYVIWRVFMKKYSKVRLGIHNVPVIPADRRAPPADKETETWSLAVEQPNDSHNQPKVSDGKPNEAINSEQQLPARAHETRKSKSRRVKSYLKRCKGALTIRGDETSCERKRAPGPPQTSWYVDKKDPKSEEEDGEEEEDGDEGEIRPEELFELCKPSAVRRVGSRGSLYEDARDDVGCGAADARTEDNGSLNSSDTLIAETCQEPPSGGDRGEEASEDDPGPATPTFIPNAVVRGDAASLVRSYLGPIYGEHVLDILTRQARDILVCAYHGNLENFVKSYLFPAVKLLSEVKRVASKKGNELVTPVGWPLTLGGHGLVLRLGELEASSLRLGECYLCVRSAAASPILPSPSTPSTAGATATTTSQQLKITRTPAIADEAIADAEERDSVEFEKYLA